MEWIQRVVDTDGYVYYIPMNDAKPDKQTTLTREKTEEEEEQDNQWTW